MAADKNLIQGAAALAQSEGNMSRAFGAGLTQEATRIAGDIMKREEERQAQVKNDMNLAAQFIGKMASTGTAAGQYKNILTSEGMNVKNRLNEIALDPSLNAVEKAAAYTKAVDEYNVLASTYAGDQEKLVNLQGIVRAGNYSNTIERDSEEFGIARALGLGEYKIIKDGYLVNGKKITSAELDKYVGLYKPKNIEAFAKLDSELRSSIRDAKGDKSSEESILNEALSIPVEQKLNYLVDYKNQAYSNFVNENNELNEEVINIAYNTEMNNLQTESAVSPIVKTREDGFTTMLTQRAENGIKNLGNYSSYVGLKYAGSPIAAMGIETNPNSEDLGKIKIIQRIGGKNVITYRNADDVEFMRDMYTRKLLDQAEGKDERNKARVIANTYFDTFLEINKEEDEQTADDINKKYEDNPKSLNEQDKTFINDNKELFPNIVKDQENLIETEEEATTTKMSRPQKERLRGNWLVKVNDGEFDKYLQDNNIPKEGAINKSTGMVKSTIVNRPDFKEAFGNEYPANTYREGSVLLGKMQSEFYGKDFTGTPTGGFTKETRTEYEQRTQATKKEELGKTDKKNRAKYFRKSAKDLSAYDQLAKNDENIPKLSAEDFESFIDTGELDGKYVNIILNNKDKFSSTLIDLIQKNFK